MARITVEDCLEKIPSRFLLVQIAAQRARQLIHGAPAHVKSDNRAVVTSLREVASGDVWAEEAKPAKKAAKEKLEAGETAAE